MNKTAVSTLLLICVLMNSAHAENKLISILLQEYKVQGASTADAEQGKQLWQKTYSDNGQRSCVTCHTKDLTQYGKHTKTGKLIKPMSPAVNTERLTDSKKVEKWFRRNCKWTLGRECTAQEKSDILVYLGRSSKF